MAAMSETTATTPGAPGDAAAAGRDPVAGSPVYPAGSRVNEAGHLEVGGCDVVDLAREFGTPAYIYVPDDIAARARAYMEGCAALTDNFEVLFASKAAPITAIYELCREQGLSADVASGGELSMALAAGFTGERILMHGNNKTEAELEFAIASGVGTIVIDSFDEIDRLERLLDRPQRVLIRLTPGIQPSTHTYVQTGQLDSKFGFGLAHGVAAAAVERIAGVPNLRLAGVHAHIGSQIFELEPFEREVEALAGFCAEHLPDPEILDLGGGLGIAYAASDEPPSIAGYVGTKIGAVRRHFSADTRVLLEPGRSLVGNAGLTVYEVGTVKEIPSVRTYAAVDGGMSDNLRPMLYGSGYETLLANRASERAGGEAVTIAGMHCESGDILVRDARLPMPSPGDLLVTPATGAYGHAMANNYNGIPRPPVVFASGGDAHLVVRRETWEDLVSRDV
jgi:diaminopimelate decarboxylase